MVKDFIWRIKFISILSILRIFHHIFLSLITHKIEKRNKEYIVYKDRKGEISDESG